jgi:ATP-dependent DNA helicase RecQ
LLELIRGGALSLDAPVWKLVIVDRDRLEGCGTAAAEDFRLWLGRVWAIYQPDRPLPAIQVLEIHHPEDLEPSSLQVDAILDLSVQLRHKPSRPEPQGFSNCHGVASVVIRSSEFESVPDHLLDFGEPLQPQIDGADLEQELTFFLQNIFRKRAFRPKQFEIIRRALKGESVIALLPTGAGKSITYQLPALLQNGMTVVVDPIKSLMKDQVDNLQALGISISTFINSMNKDARERRLNMRRMQQGGLKFVFVSPERFIVQEFREALTAMRDEKRVHFAFAVIDEAHCVSEWGHDFRTAYLRIGANARTYCPTRQPQLPVLALTGTASFEVLDDIQAELGYENDAAISIRPDSMQRHNLKYRVVPLTPPPQLPKGAPEGKFWRIPGEIKQEQLPRVLSDITQTLAGVDLPAFVAGGMGSGLIFCPHKKNVHGAEGVRGTLHGAFEQVAEYFGVYYGAPEEGAGVSGFDPVRTQNDFKQGKLRVLACTKAFGMGIDKPDIRFTLHFNIPPSLESFYQEAGRAGRDGDEAQCWIIYAGTQLPGGNHSIDYRLNHSFHANTFPGAALEEAKVFDLLDANRGPGNPVRREIAAMLFAVTGHDYTIGLFHPPASDFYRIYINHPDYPDAKVFVTIAPTGDLTPGTTVPFPQHEVVLSLVVEWLKQNRPDDDNWQAFLFDELQMTTTPGLEELLEVHGPQTVCLSTDNGYLKEIASRLKVPPTEIYNAYNFVANAKTFIANLPASHEISASTKEWISSVFPKIRQREHTFRAIYRLTVLGAVEDFVADYARNTITATLSPLPPEHYRENLRKYIQRYAPMNVAYYLGVADQCAYPTELRRCLHALIRFVYDRIAKQRLTALKIMEQTTVRGLDNPDEFAETVVTYFDSGYLPVLRPHANSYSADLVFEVCAETAASPPKLKHLLGACNRLLEEHPENAAFHALRAYAIALLGYRSQDIKDEIDTSLACFERFSGWGRGEKLDFLMRLRGGIAGISLDCARVFDATIIEDHVNWLHAFNQRTSAHSLFGEEGSKADV